MQSRFKFSSFPSLRDTSAKGNKQVGQDLGYRSMVCDQAISMAQYLLESFKMSFCRHPLQLLQL